VQPDCIYWLKRPISLWFAACMRAGVTGLLELTRGDELFAALDGHILATPDARWELRVAGIHEEHSYMWTQLIISGPRQYAATFRTDSANPSEVLASVSDWLAECETTQPSVLSLVRM
jgi:hypothetical protein